MAALQIPVGLYQQMVEHCRDGLPNEACGFLAGSNMVVEKIYLLDNEAASPVYYRPVGGQMIEAMGNMDELGLDLLAIFHSHVASDPYPSPTDIREAHYPGTVYLIVSLKDEEAKARGFLIHKDDWRAETGRVEEIDLVVS